jgi:Na+-driven multidrug efflux pump
MIILSIALLVFLEPIIILFSLSEAANKMAAEFLEIHCISMAIGWGFSFALPNALRAAGDARFVMIAATISMWTVRVSAAYLLTFTFNIGPLGVWLAMGADFMVRGTLYGIRWYRGKWQGQKVIGD